MKSRLDTSLLGFLFLNIAPNYSNPPLYSLLKPFTLVDIKDGYFQGHFPVTPDLNFYGYALIPSLCIHLFFFGFLHLGDTSISLSVSAWSIIDKFFFIYNLIL